MHTAPWKGKFQSVRGFFGNGLGFYLALGVIWIISIALIAFSAYYLYKTPLVQKIMSGKKGEGETSTSTPKPSPIPLASGKQIYMISGSLPGAAKIAEATVDPIDPATATQQKLTLQVLDTKGVTEVRATVYTDNKAIRHPLSLKSGTKTDGIWEGSWSLGDSYDYRYGIVLKAKNEDGLWTTNTLTFR